MLPGHQPKGARSTIFTSRIAYSLLKSNKVKTLKSLLHKNFEKREGSKVAKICSVRPAIASGSFEHPSHSPRMKVGLKIWGSASHGRFFSIANLFNREVQNFIPSNFAPKITNVDAETSNPLQIRKVPNASSNITNLQEKIADEIFETQDPPPIKTS